MSAPHNGDRQSRLRLHRPHERGGGHNDGNGCQRLLHHHRHRHHQLPILRKNFFFFNSLFDKKCQKRNSKIVEVHSCENYWNDFAESDIFQPNCFCNKSHGQKVFSLPHFFAEHHRESNWDVRVKGKHARPLDHQHGPYLGLFRKVAFSLKWKFS